ncbi:hypothetical protein AVEN_39861-1 [Araneus ventricosus]|uniref:Uncharacterized protein n=1 Tax=Araneus ventricosus TaxID=182803 RepID=A0A4Y2VRT8_ARAVE|nr:hypothetical protein AVEN_39861-1 [Araneus ventricosus]
MGLLHAKSYVVSKRPPADVARKCGEGVPAQLSSSSSDRGSKLREGASSLTSGLTIRGRHLSLSDGSEEEHPLSLSRRSEGRHLSPQTDQRGRHPLTFLDGSEEAPPPPGGQRRHPSPILTDQRRHPPTSLTDQRGEASSHFLDGVREGGTLSHSLTDQRRHPLLTSRRPEGRHLSLL